MLKIIEKTKLWFGISLLIIVIGLGFLVTKGLNFGIDFRGGTQLVIDMGKDFEKAEIDSIVTKYANDAVTNKVENTQLEIKSNNLDSEKISSMFKEIKEKYNLEDKALVSQDEIGQSVGRDLTNKAIIALLVANVAMLIYVAIRFEFKFGLAAILALVHDILITISIYAIFNVPVNSPFIAAILTIVGYSINDTIVIFDRIRENGKTMRRVNVTELANISITQTMSRSINTVLTTLITITAVYVFVPTVREFAFPLIIGILSGAYSSIFIASPLWVIFKNRTSKSRA
ncbi:protein translocase subunit SecF [Desnuesiella massiliensis]|uniref:protein translocase subunit SecF n=1 Tax=Desnuesiella massiliensis TaxID=1650662 RepID=UPI0006E1EFE5|nr:protein translocase subunit SecF [Desnuesiella massiliensis]